VKGRFQMQVAPGIPIYEIRVKGRLTDRWLRRFDGMRFEHREGETCIVGPVPDQPALEAMLITIGDLGLTLLSVRLLDEG
jgi:hypothetical protein